MLKQKLNFRQSKNPQHGSCSLVGCATYLSPFLIDAPVYVLSIGGVISDDPGIRHVKHLTQSRYDFDTHRAKNYNIAK
jgi:hypothetical protein